MSKSTDHTPVIRDELTHPKYGPVPVLVPTLEGGDPEGIYVTPVRCVEIDALHTKIRLTPEQARQMAAELVAAAEVIEGVAR